MPFLTDSDLAEARRDFEAELGPHTLTLVRIVEGQSETGGPDRTEQLFTDQGGRTLTPAYRARPLRTPRTRREGEQTIVVADWEIRLPWSFAQRVLAGDQLDAAEGRFSVFLVDNRADALLCRLECLLKEPARG